MITVNSLSGGKTSSYIAANYPADYNVFALVRTEHEASKFPDEKIRKEVEDRIQAPFTSTAEDDTIIYTMLDLEQYIGQKIHWVTGRTFDDVMHMKQSGRTFIPQPTSRFCTTKMKMLPIMDWWYKEISEVIDMRIGFRANETKRVARLLKRCDENGIQNDRIRVEINKDKNDKWKFLDWRKPSFPLVNDNIYKDNVEEFWKDKPVRFAWQNNCIGCFHANPLNLHRKSKMFPEKFDWFVQKEKQSMKDYDGRRFYMGDYNNITYEDIQKWNLQYELFDEDFNDCDSGYCGV